jgi:chromosome segregation ATPase
MAAAPTAPAANADFKAAVESARQMQAFMRSLGRLEEVLTAAHQAEDQIGGLNKQLAALPPKIAALQHEFNTKQAGFEEDLRLLSASVAAEREALDALRRECGAAAAKTQTDCTKAVQEATARRDTALAIINDEIAAAKAQREEAINALADAQTALAEFKARLNG